MLLLRRGNQKISQTFRLTPMWIMPQSSLCCGNHNGKKDTIFLVGGVYLCLSYNEELHASYRGEQQGKYKQRGSNCKEQIPKTTNMAISHLSCHYLHIFSAAPIVNSSCVTTSSFQGSLIQKVYATSSVTPATRIKD